MSEPRPIWLVDNSASGSNDGDNLQLLEASCGSAGFTVVRRTRFPRQDLPSPAMLDAAGVDIVAVFAGDGTINATISQLAGWQGAVLVLPGGTMNLLYHRLHGEADMHDVVCAAAQGRATRTRPAIVRGPGGAEALAGLMAGPGTSWNRVREAMREHSILEMAGETVRAIEATLGAPMIACTEPPLGRSEGYPLVLLNPTEGGIVVEAYYAQTAREYLEQSFALLRRDFRQGPHEELGRADRVRLTSTDARPFGLLVDGEPFEAPAEAEFVLAAAQVDLLATIR